MDHQRNSRVIKEKHHVVKSKVSFAHLFSAKSFSKGELKVTREDEFELVRVSTSKGWRKYESRDPEENYDPKERKAPPEKEIKSDTEHIVQRSCRPTW